MDGKIFSAGRRHLRHYKSLGQLLIEMQIINEKQLEPAMAEQRKTGELLGQIIVRRGLAAEKEIMEALAAQTGMPVVNLSRLKISPKVIKQISPSLAKIYKVVPIRQEGKALIVAISDPFNTQILDDLRFILNCDVRGAIASEKEIVQIIKKYYGKETENLEGLLKKLSAASLPGRNKEEISEPDIASLQELARQVPIVKLVNLVLIQAVKDRASDVHFEPYEDIFKIRYRLDGILYEMSPPPPQLSLGIISRLKVMADLDIAERRLPQDGRMEINVEGKRIDIRVSTLPTAFGESLVLRILDRSIVMLSLDEIGLLPDSLSTIEKQIKHPHGMILATGPTGCGKTTTLYSILKKVNEPVYKIITTEDPVEYNIPGVIQVPIRPQIKLNFSTCLRHILRQDPDIIMVGEIRDQATAEIAIHAALTGHLVLSTLHTNDAPETITRLIDMGMEPFLITSTLDIIIAQRLVRILCPQCKETYRPGPEELSLLGVSLEKSKELTLYRPKGCSLCRNIGYRGRTAIFEILRLNDEIRESIVNRATTEEIRRKARKEGMRSLKQDGLQKVFQGITSLEEILRETQTFI
ncbi:MAG: ATPase, T2SS/T4P/T4SS family [Candidatus Ratteibacteria bacterium]|nr:ATPase, T2SS/T4P/T4SS family [Candidatus Ratteibacteria bacterium]